MDPTDSELVRQGKKLPLVESFYSIQGEGHNAGKASFFLRLGGCDIGCHWCDTKFSWNADIHELTDVAEIVSWAGEAVSRIVVVTGGAPLLYNLDYICSELKKQHFETHLETSGVYALTGEWDWICVSPKSHNPPGKKIMEQANELKIIVFSEEDLQWAEHMVSLAPAGCKLYLQPEWSRFEKIIPVIINYIKQHPEWEISLQIHKFMHIP
jgi:organic radical activating enzyme